MHLQSYKFGAQINSNLQVNYVKKCFIEFHPFDSKTWYDRLESSAMTFKRMTIDRMTTKDTQQNAQNAIWQNYIQQNNTKKNDTRRNVKGKMTLFRMVSCVMALRMTLCIMPLWWKTLSRMPLSLGKTTVRCLTLRRMPLRYMTRAKWHLSEWHSV